jgi:YfiH family protein
MSRARLDPQWIVPSWPAPPHVKAVVTTRSGGVSRGPYESFNLGFSTGDDADATSVNRSRLDAFLPQAPRWLQQVHGAHVIDAESAQERPQADASVAREADTVCAIQVADCLPVLFTDSGGSIVAAAHAGWRGLAAGVIDNTICAMGVDPHDVLAYIGPGIGPRHFEVGDDVLAAFARADAGASHSFTPAAPGKWLCDLPALARRALQRSGVTRIYGGDLCTYSDAQRFFSYRRDRETGRMAALIWRENRPAL